MSTGCHRMQIALAQEDVVNALKLHGAAILGFEQDRISDFNRADVRTHGNYLRPAQPSPDLRGSRNDDASATPSLTVFGTFTHEHPIVQELDGNSSVGSRTSIGGRRRIMCRSGQRLRRLSTLRAM